MNNAYAIVGIALIFAALILGFKTVADRPIAQVSHSEYMRLVDEAKRKACRKVYAPEGEISCADMPEDSEIAWVR